MLGLYYESICMHAMNIQDLGKMILHKFNFFENDGIFCAIFAKAMMSHVIAFYNVPYFWTQVQKDLCLQIGTIFNITQVFRNINWFSNITKNSIISRLFLMVFDLLTQSKGNICEWLCRNIVVFELRF